MTGFPHAFEGYEIINVSKACFPSHIKHAFLKCDDMHIAHAGHCSDRGF